jgi:gluconate 2-dehydrogenase gamma chain
LPVSRREFIKIGAAGAIGFGIASAIEIPILENIIQNDNKKVSQEQSQVSQGDQAFLTLNTTEQAIVEAVAETMIPTDSNGPGAKEAGVIYFIDKQLAGDYGNNARMYMQGPFVQPNQTSPITVNGITYSEGTAPARMTAGTYYQYPINLREFWRNGLSFLDAYAQSAYGNNFAKLTSTQMTQVLTDLWNNKPTNFTGPTPQEFFSEMHNLVMEGFFSDPLYGGNVGLVSWILVGFNGTNDGKAQGYTPPQEMLSTTPIRLPPRSLADLQKSLQTSGGM